jgi:hypothetical protein
MLAASSSRRTSPPNAVRARRNAGGGVSELPTFITAFPCASGEKSRAGFFSGHCQLSRLRAATMKGRQHRLDRLARHSPSREVLGRCRAARRHGVHSRDPRESRRRSRVRARRDRRRSRRGGAYLVQAGGRRRGARLRLRGRLRARTRTPRPTGCGSTRTGSSASRPQPLQTR